MSEGKMTEQDFVQMMKSIVEDGGIGRVERKYGRLMVYINSIPGDDMDILSLLDVQINSVYDHIECTYVFYCPVQIPFYGPNIHLKNTQFLENVSLQKRNHESHELLRIEACRFKKQLKIDTTNVFTIQKVVIESGSSLGELLFDKTYLNILKIKNSSFNANFNLLPNITSKFRAFNCRFWAELKVNFNPLTEGSYQFNSCHFYKFIDLSVYSDLEELEKLTIKNCNWHFEEHSKSTFRSMIKSCNGDITTFIDERKHTFFLLRNFYSEKNVKYESRHFQRLINYAYQMQEAFTRKERRALWWAHVSNDFGTNYERGIGFTIATGVLFYTALLGILTLAGRLEFAPENALATVGHFFDLINVTKWKYDFFELGNDHIVNITVYISRIFIGYGIYQSIAAFRIITKM